LLGEPAEGVGAGIEVVSADGVAEDVRLEASGHVGPRPQRMTGGLLEGGGVELSTDGTRLDQREVDVPEDEPVRGRGTPRPYHKATDPPSPLLVLVDDHAADV